MQNKAREMHIKINVPYQQDIFITSTDPGFDLYQHLAYGTTIRTTASFTFGLDERNWWHTCFGNVDRDVIPLIGHRIFDVSGHLDFLAAADMVFIDGDLERTAADRFAILRHFDRVCALRLGLERRNAWTTDTVTPSRRCSFILFRSYIVTFESTDIAEK